MEDRSQIQEHQSEVATPTLTRREFLVLSKRLGALYMLSLLSQGLISCSSPTVNEQTQASAQATASEHVRQTDQARGPDVYEAEMSNIPEKLQRSAVRLEMHFDQGSLTFTSGTVWNHLHSYSRTLIKRYWR